MRIDAKKVRSGLLTIGNELERLERQIAGTPSLSDDWPHTPACQAWSGCPLCRIAKAVGELESLVSKE